MAATASSSNSTSVTSPPVPKKEPKREHQQDGSSEIKDAKLMKRELEDSKEAVKREPVDRNDVKREQVDVKNVKEEPLEDPFAGLRRILKKMDTDKEPEVTKEVKREADKQVKKESEEDPFDFLDSKEHKEKFQKYEADFKQHLMNEYFSEKTIFGGNIYDVKVDMDGQTIKSSRLPPYQSYLDPATYFELLKGTESGSSTETSAAAAGSSNPNPPSTEGN